MRKRIVIEGNINLVTVTNLDTGERGTTTFVGELPANAFAAPPMGLADAWKECAALEESVRPNTPDWRTEYGYARVGAERAKAAVVNAKREAAAEIITIIDDLIGSYRSEDSQRALGDVRNRIWRTL